MGEVYGTHPLGGGGVAGPGAYILLYIYIHIIYIHIIYCTYFTSSMWIRPFSIAHAETRGFLDSPASAFALFQGIRSAEAAEIWLNDGS